MAVVTLASPAAMDLSVCESVIVVEIPECATLISEVGGEAPLAWVAAIMPQCQGHHSNPSHCSSTNWDGVEVVVNRGAIPSTPI
jgi:hypothetical protein